MAKEKQRPDNSVIQVAGLHTDNSLVAQPQGSTTFVLNGVNETNQGDSGFISVEESNEVFYTLPAGFIPIGEAYVGNREKIIFLASGAGNSIISLVNSKGDLSILIDDSAQTDKIGFKVSQQIDATYRLRRGCERTVYWVDPKPRSFIIEKLEDYKKTGSEEWLISSFDLFKRPSTIPVYKTIKIKNSGGQLAPGSYNFSLRYLDSDLNPTEFISSTETILIYKDSVENPYKDVRGSSIISTSYYSGEITSKAIELTVDNLDPNYPFYQIAIIEANTGTGQIAKVRLSAEMATSNTIFTYTGTNHQTDISVEDVLMFNNIIEEASSITQVENRLILSDVTGKKTNLCNLQKYASRITADCVTKPILLNSIKGANSKNGEVHHEGLGYMPGELYSFAVVYVFEDTSESPAYHIPGRAPSMEPTKTFNLSTISEKYYPMDGDNACKDMRYTDASKCSSQDYWGLDSTGIALKNSLIRHHRFPLRGVINKPLVSEELISSVEKELHALRVTIEHPTKVFNPPCITDTTDPEYVANCVNTYQDTTLEITYQFEGNERGQAINIGYKTWDHDTTIGQQAYIGPFLGNTPTAITLKETSATGVVTNITLTLSGSTYIGTSPETNFKYSVILEDYIAQDDKKLYSSEIFGISFSNITLPPVEDTAGQKVVGYYIVRQERTEDEKTILDTAVLTSTLQNDHFTSHGLLMPTLDPSSVKIKKDVLSIINPEFKFNNKVYQDFDEIIKQGEYYRTEVKDSRFIVQNVMDGTSYDGEHHQKSERDNDGWDLQVRTRDNQLAYRTTSGTMFDKEDIKDVFYLDALTSKTITDSTGTNTTDVFNISCDNKIGIMSLNRLYTEPVVTTLPYVVLKRNLANPYSNFRTTSYHKESKGVIYFEGEAPSSTKIFNGDSYISSMKYVSSVFYENRVKKRKGKRSLWGIIGGGLLVIVGVAAAIFTAGASLSLVAAGITLAGAAGVIAIGGTLAASGIKQANWNRVYNDLYAQGLRETVEDDTLKQHFKDVNPGDDEIRWFGDALTNLWFESGVNMSLRQGANVGTDVDFINAPTAVETGNGLNGGKEAKTTLDRYMLSKLTVVNSERAESAREYTGIALPELYEVNPDYYRRNKEKVYEALGIEYDCCSDCYEEFPHRVMFSEQAFQEELTDNFRTFLPNNYKDIEGETGRIVDMFRIQSNLYIHTEEALWHLPQNYQERVTGGVVSFIGTGNYFDTAPRKIVDATDSSAGNQHKWGRLKTRNGVLFPCHTEKKWYLFNGQELKPISDMGMSTEFEKNMNFLIADQYYKGNNKPYPYNDNPSNPIGIGYISAYDTLKERLIITKKDNQISNLPEGDYQLCNAGGATTIFNNFSQTIATQKAAGWNYTGIKKCKLQFEKVDTVMQDIITYITTTTEGMTVSADTIVVPFFDTTSMDSNIITNISNTLDAWFPSFKASVNGGNNNVTFINPTWSRWGSELWVSDPAYLTLVNLGANKDILLLVFVDETNPSYHGSTLSSPMSAPTASYISNVNDFINIHYPQFKSFKAINYPIVQQTDQCKEYLQHAVAAIEAKNLTLEEALAVPKNPFFTDPQWATVVTNLQSNPYAGQPLLKDYGWYYKTNRVSAVDGNGSVDCPVDGVSVIPPCQFTKDIDGLLTPSTTTPGTEETTEVITSTPTQKTIYKEVAGTLFTPITVNNSHTMSYSLKNNTWTSWHSYLPSFYSSIEGSFFSWETGGTAIYKHNKLGSYRTFYGRTYPFIVEYVDNDNPIATKITDSLLFQTEAKKYDANLKEFYDVDDVTFNKLLVYNTRQISGWKNLVTKNPLSTYLSQQTTNTTGSILIDRNERDWTVNELRDYSSVSKVPMFSKKLTDLQASYFIDKTVNPLSVNLNKDWSELESFRDKFLVIRLVFDTFVDTKLTMNFTVSDKKQSER